MRNRPRSVLTSALMLAATVRPARVLTPWFKPGTNPRRAGVYPVRYFVSIGVRPPQKVEGYSYWSRRKGWCSLDSTVEGALRRNHCELGRVDWTASARRLQPEWRGLMSAPNTTKGHAHV